MQRAEFKMETGFQANLFKAEAECRNEKGGLNAKTAKIAKVGRRELGAELRNEGGLIESVVPSGLEAFVGWVLGVETPSYCRGGPFGTEFGASRSGAVRRRALPPPRSARRATFVTGLAELAPPGSGEF